MKTYKTITYETSSVIVDTITCNMCGLPCDAHYDSNNELSLQHAVTIKVIGEFRHQLLNGDVQWFDLCELCLVTEIIDKLKIKPTVGIDYSWVRPESESKEEEYSKKD